MRRELVDKLQNDFPQIFQDLWGDNMTTCMAYGITCCDGWYDLIHKLCSDIMVLDPGPNFKVTQVKEKFGGLRFYVSGADEDKWLVIGPLIRDAENDSYKICEHCGTREEVTVNKRGYIQTLCDSCRKGIHRCES